MATAFISSRDFNRDPGSAKRAALAGPVIITDRRKPAHVLLSFADYERLTGGGASIDALLAMKNAGEIDFDPPRLDGSFAVPALD